MAKHKMFTEEISGRQILVSSPEGKKEVYIGAGDGNNEIIVKLTEIQVHELRKFLFDVTKY